MGHHQLHGRGRAKETVSSGRSCGILVDTFFPFLDLVLCRVGYAAILAKDKMWRLVLYLRASVAISLLYSSRHTFGHACCSFESTFSPAMAAKFESRHERSSIPTFDTSLDHGRVCHVGRVSDDLCTTGVSYFWSSRVSFDGEVCLGLKMLSKGTILG